MENTVQNQYLFQGMRFVPGYDNFDHDDCVPLQHLLRKKHGRVIKYTKRFTCKSVSLTHINGVEVQN